MLSSHCEVCRYTNILRVGPAGAIQHCGYCGSSQAAERATTQVYDARYVAERYERYATTEEMSSLRLQVIESVLFLFDYDRTVREIPLYETHRYRLLDIGFGNGSFIRTTREKGWDAYGHDVNPTEYEGVRRKPLPVEPLPPEERYRVITFFDCLEHFETLARVRQISRNTDWIFISIPAPPYVWWLNPESWKHYRPGEHHFYPDPTALAGLFCLPEVHVQQMWSGYPEDLIRGALPCGAPNIATVALRCFHDEKGDSDE